MNLLGFKAYRSGFWFLLQSPDGDIIDCVLSYLQPAFDHPELRGQKPLVNLHFFVYDSLSI